MKLMAAVRDKICGITARAGISIYEKDFTQFNRRAHLPGDIKEQLQLAIVLATPGLTPTTASWYLKQGINHWGAINFAKTPIYSYAHAEPHGRDRDGWEKTTWSLLHRLLCYYPAAGQELKTALAHAYAVAEKYIDCSEMLPNSFVLPKAYRVTATPVLGTAEQLHSLVKNIPNFLLLMPANVIFKLRVTCQLVNAVIMTAVRENPHTHPAYLRLAFAPAIANPKLGIFAYNHTDETQNIFESLQKRTDSLRYGNKISSEISRVLQEKAHTTQRLQDYLEQVYRTNKVIRKILNRMMGKELERQNRRVRHPGYCVAYSHHRNVSKTDPILYPDGKIPPADRRLATSRFARGLYSYQHAGRVYSVKYQSLINNTIFMLGDLCHANGRDVIILTPPSGLASPESDRLSWFGIELAILQANPETWELSLSKNAESGHLIFRRVTDKVDPIAVCENFVRFCSNYTTPAELAAHIEGSIQRQASALHL